jgi:hypothetical protein
VQIDHSRSGDAIDIRTETDDHEIGGEQSVVGEPYRTELLAIWRFRTTEVARQSAEAIYARFLEYRDQRDLVGMDMARRFLQMGWTRSRRYATHKNGRKWTRGHRELLPAEADPEKAESARIFYEFYLAARSDPLYKELMAWHRGRESRTPTIRDVARTLSPAVEHTEEKVPKG